MIPGQLGQAPWCSIPARTTSAPPRPSRTQRVHALGQAVPADRPPVARHSLVEHQPADLGGRTGGLERAQGTEGMPDQIGPGTAPTAATSSYSHRGAYLGASSLSPWPRRSSAYTVARRSSGGRTAPNACRRSDNARARAPATVLGRRPRRRSRSRRGRWCEEPEPAQATTTTDLP